MKEIIITNKDDGIEITLPSMPYGESITIINESNKPVIIIGSTHMQFKNAKNVERLNNG